MFKFNLGRPNRIESVSATWKDVHRPFQMGSVKRNSNHVPLTYMWSIAICIPASCSPTDKQGKSHEIEKSHCIESLTNGTVRCCRYRQKHAKIQRPQKYLIHALGPRIRPVGGVEFPQPDGFFRRPANFAEVDCI